MLSSWTVKGTADKIMKIDVVQDFIDRLTALGNDNRFEIEDGWTHETTCKKVLVEKDLVEKHLQDFSFVDPVFELWLKREYNILP